MQRKRKKYSKKQRIFHDIPKLKIYIYIYNFPRSPRSVKKNTKHGNGKYEHQIYQSIKLGIVEGEIRGQYEFLRGRRLNRARLNGQSNDKCISYATMSPADSRKIENKSCGDLHSRMRQAHGTQ